MGKDEEKFVGWIKRSESTESSLWLRRHNKERGIKGFETVLPLM